MKAFYRTVLLIMLLFVLMGMGVFVQGAKEHFSRPLVSTTTPGIRSSWNEAFQRAFVAELHVPV